MHGLGGGVNRAQVGQRLCAVLLTGTGQQVMVLPHLLFLLPASFSTRSHLSPGCLVFDLAHSLKSGNVMPALSKEPGPMEMCLELWGCMGSHGFPQGTCHGSHSVFEHQPALYGMKHLVCLPFLTTCSLPRHNFWLGPLDQARLSVCSSAWK